MIDRRPAARGVLLVGLAVGVLWFGPDRSRGDLELELAAECARSVEIRVTSRAPVPKLLHRVTARRVSTAPARVVLSTPWPGDPVRIVLRSECLDGSAPTRALDVDTAEPDLESGVLWMRCPCGHTPGRTSGT